METLNLIIRGYLYKENRKPFHSAHWWTYTIDFFTVRDSYEKLVKSLSVKYDVKVYFATYDTTPEFYINNLKEFPNFKGFVLANEEGSYQFTTACKALKELPKELSLVIRADLIMTPQFIKEIVNKNYTNDAVYVFSRSSDFLGSSCRNIYDLLHVVPKSKIKQFVTEKVDFFGTLDRCIELHHLNQFILVDYILEHNNKDLPIKKLAPDGVDENLANSYCSRFWKVYRGKDYDACNSQENIMRQQITHDLVRSMPKLKDKFDFTKPIKIEIGGGIKPKNGYINCDIIDDEKVDIKCDFEKGLPFADDFADEIYSSHCLEHVENISGLIREIARVCKVGSTVTIAVPHFGQEMALCPGHKHVIGAQMAHHFSEFEESWWHGMTKMLYLDFVTYTPTNWFPRAKNLFPNLTDEEIFRYIQKTCHEIVMHLKVKQR